MSKQFDKGTFHRTIVGCFFWAAVLKARHFWGDPYLNSTTVLFDNFLALHILVYGMLNK